MKIPDEILALFDQESEGLVFGSVHLELFLRDGRPRFVLTTERSILPKADELSTDAALHSIEKKRQGVSAARIVVKGGGK
jgi:hypothetical protein